MVQPIEGLVFSPTVLADKGIGRPDEGPAQLQRQFLELCPYRQIKEGKEEQPSISDLCAFLEQFLQLTPDLFDAGDALPKELSLDVPEANQVLRPTLALRKLAAVDVPEGTDATEAAKAGAAYEMLVWDLADPACAGVDAIGLDLDEPEALTGEWRYPPTAKFDRLLRHVRVPIGLLTNRDELRLIYAPHGESTGHLTFRLKHMDGVDGRNAIDALRRLLSANSFFLDPSTSLPVLLAECRERQANVTTELADQVFDALQVLLAGFQAAAERDPDGYGRVWNEALARENDHVYRGLLTVMLRMVFLLFAEDRALLPVEHDMYQKHLSVFALFARLQEEAGAHPDSMAQRYGAWGQLLVVFRAVFTGVRHGKIHMPPRHGDLFDPHRYPFLEGVVAGASPINSPEFQSEVVVPTLDDGTVFAVLEKLILFDGQRLSYKALDVEQIGSVYEALMGYHVEAMPGAAVRMKGGRWTSVDEVLDVKPAQRAKWLKTETDLSKSQATKLKKRFDEIAKDEELDDSNRIEAYRDALADYSAGGRRKDKNGVLARAGQLVLQPGAERRRTSSHYTPRSLSAPIVERTLEPLIRAMGSEPSADQLLELKVCDPAMGSGAFLVAACGNLGDQLVAAWTREGKLEDVARDAPNEDPVLYARRLVAQRCLYGVDKNEAAVELAKLSLWLFTLARDRPFTFLDHALRHGDSLVGLSFEQIRSFTWEPEAKAQQLTTARQELDAALSEAIPIRQRILDLAKDPSPEAQLEKENLVRDAADALDRARLIGDVIVGAFFAEKKKKAREKELKRRWDITQKWLAGDSEAGEQLRQQQLDIRERLPVFHWMLEFPEVFWDQRPDPLAEGATDDALMDAFVGNPPFAGKNGIIESGGDGYLEFLLETYPHAHGNSDLSAFFFLRAAELLGAHGAFGLIATNTIAQGDTRRTGLQHLVSAKQFQIYDATSSLMWPVPGAAVMVALVHALRGVPRVQLHRKLDGRVVRDINSRLRANPERPDPVKLDSNAGCAFVGSYVLGSGFVLSPEERDELLTQNSKNAERIFPYLGGRELNSSPTQSHERYVIYFAQMSLAEAQKWPDLIGRLEQLVKPERDRNKRESRKKYWWRFGEPAPALYSALAPLSRCLAIADVSKHLSFAFQPASRVFSHALNIFPLECETAFAVLQSRLHQGWASVLSSTMKGDQRYKPSDCFETFPFPKPDPRSVIPELEAIGKKLYDARADYMVGEQVGLTETYNRLKNPSETDPRIQTLRTLHEQMDQAVLTAYAKETRDRTWTKIDVPRYCAASTEEAVKEAHAKTLETFNDQVIDALFVLNAKRVGLAVQPPLSIPSAARPAFSVQQDALMLVTAIVHELDAIDYADLVRAMVMLRNPAAVPRPLSKRLADIVAEWQPDVRETTWQAGTVRAIVAGLAERSALTIDVPVDGVVRVRVGSHVVATEDLGAWPVFEARLAGELLAELSDEQLEALPIDPADLEAPAA